MTEIELIKKRRKSILIKLNEITVECFSSLSVADWQRFERLMRERDQCLKLLEFSEKEYHNNLMKVDLDAEETKLKDLLIASEKKLFSLIDQEKGKVVSEMQSLRKSKEVISKFKSSWINEAGEEIDKTL